MMEPARNIWLSGRYCQQITQIFNEMVSKTSVFTCETRCPFARYPAPPTNQQTKQEPVHFLTVVQKLLDYGPWRPKNFTII